MKIEAEKKVFAQMVGIYCHGKHKVRYGLCQSCQELLDYGSDRLDKCPFQDDKVFCSKCVIRCYREDMRERVRELMRYSGMRLFIRHPIMTIKHYLS